MDQGLLCPANQLVDGLEEEARVLELNVDDTKPAFILEAAGRSPGDLAVTTGALGSAFPQHATARLVHPFHRGNREAEGGHSVDRLQGHDGVDEGEAAAPGEELDPPPRDAPLDGEGELINTTKNLLIHDD